MNATENKKDVIKNCGKCGGATVIYEKDDRIFKAPFVVVCKKCGLWYDKY